MNLIFNPATLSFTLTILMLATHAFAQQKFNLTIPGDAKPTSVAEINGNTLTVTRPTGKKFAYTRFPAYDAGGYQAFWGAATKQYVRFPINASGQKMQLGRLSGTSLTWTDSQMRVWKVGAKPASPSPPTGAGNSGGSNYTGTTTRPAQINVNGKVYVAFVDGQGKLQMFRENNLGKWERQPLSWSQKLAPDSGIGLVQPATPSQLPGVLSISANKRMVYLVDGKTLKELRGIQSSPEFVTGSSVAVSPNGNSCFACDRSGVICEYNFQLGDFTIVEARPNFVTPGGPVAALNNDLFVIDKTGNLVGYSRSRNSWSKPFLLGSGFQSGGSIASWQGRGLVSSQKAVASVNQNGNPLVYVWENRRWNPETLNNVTLRAGTPIGIGNRSGTLVLSFVDRKGNWLTYRRSTGGLVSSWTPNTLSTGFLSSSPLLLGPNAGSAFSINRRGQLIAARFNNNRWNLTPFQGLIGLGLGQRILSREIVPNPPLASVEIVLKNDHKEPLLIRVFDRRGKKKKYDVTIKPFQSTSIVIERDSGGIANETFVAAGPLGSIQQNRVVQIAPKVLYDVVVFENPVTSQFFDRTKPKSKYKKKPDSETRSLRSVGVFEIPPGKEMAAGGTLSAFAEAKKNNNPGGARLFGPIKQ